jgi:hypothetical protein
LVVDDVTADSGPPLPSGLTLVGRVVHYNNTPSFTEVSALLNPSEEVRPGQMLGVWHGRRGRDIVTVVQVANSFEVNPNEAAELAAAREALGLARGYAGEGVSTRIYRVAQCPTIEEFDLAQQDGLWRVVGEGRSPELLSRAGDPLVSLPRDIALRAIGAQADPEAGVHLGVTYGTDPVPVAIVPEALQLHIGVFGNPGKGKSYLAGNILEEAYRWGIPSLVLDVNGELIAAAQSLKGQVITLPDPDKFGLSLNQLTPQELVSVTPNVQQGTIYAELIEMAHDRLRGEAQGKKISFESLKTRIAEIGATTEAKKPSIGAALARVSALERDPLIGRDYDFIEQLVRHRLILLDCRFLSLRQTQLIAAAAARELQRVGREMARKAEAGDDEAAKWFALYFVDEAHIVIPDDEKVVSTQVHFELARMGRHVRTGMVLSSQSPQDLHPSVLKRLQTRFIFALERDQLRNVQGVLADLDERIVSQLPKLPRGVCAVSGSSEVVRHGFLLRVRERATPVKGRTPKVFDGRVKRPLEL